MSRTARKTSFDSSANGAARRTASYELVDAALVDRAHRDELLRQHVERVPQVPRVLDLAGQHPLRHDRGLEEVAPELGEDPAARRLADLVAGPADPLEPARDRAGGLHLDHEVDGAHVDPELERGRRDDRAEPSLLEGVLDLQTLLAREGAVMRAHEILAGELVQARRESLGQPPGVREHDRRAVRADQLQQRRVDRGPDRAARLPVAVRPAPSPPGRRRSGARPGRRARCRRPCPRPGRPPGAPSACDAPRRRS